MNKRDSSIENDAKTEGQATNGSSAVSQKHKIFDDVARIIVSSIPRRKALKLSLAGLAGAALMEFGLRPAWAAVSCDCNGITFDTDTACCTPSGVQQKHPILDLAACPDKAPHPGFVPIPNGCGPAGGSLAPFIPERFGPANFTSCCNTHDVCYGTCNDDKGDCDNSFFGCLASTCTSAFLLRPPQLLAACLTVAGIYFSAVSLRGQKFYDAAQTQACDCCGPQGCNSCEGAGTCAGAPVCGDGGCVCFQTVEGNGFCHRGQPCAGSQTCTSTADCPSGFACSNITCCGSQAICIQPCSEGFVPQLATPMGPMTTGI
jgi:hypothetical protein